MARPKLASTKDFFIGTAIKLWIFAVFAFCALCSSRACGEDVKQLLAESHHQAVSCGCKSGQFVEEDGRHYWQTEGLRTFADGSTNKGLIFRAQYHTIKEMRKIRKKALIECADWLDKQETRANK
jgi:hypothetical protein